MGCGSSKCNKINYYNNYELEELLDLGMKFIIYNKKIYNIEHLFNRKNELFDLLIGQDITKFIDNLDNNNKKKFVRYFVGYIK